MKKMIEKIRAAKHWQERVAIAENEYPSTDFDFVFGEVSKAKRWIAALPSNFKHAPRAIKRQDCRYLQLMDCYEVLGHWLATMIDKGEVQTLHGLADALVKWNKHKAKARPDYDLIALLRLTVANPPGWEKTYGRDSRDKLALGFKPIPKGTRVTIAARDIRKWIERELGRKLSYEEWERRRKRIQRYAKEFGIPLDDTPSSKK